MGSEWMMLASLNEFPFAPSSFSLSDFSDKLAFLPSLILSYKVMERGEKISLFLGVQQTTGREDKSTHFLAYLFTQEDQGEEESSLLTGHLVISQSGKGKEHPGKQIVRDRTLRTYRNKISELWLQVSCLLQVPFFFSFLFFNLFFSFNIFVETDAWVDGWMSQTEWVL